MSSVSLRGAPRNAKLGESEGVTRSLHDGMSADFVDGRDARGCQLQAAIAERSHPGCLGKAPQLGERRASRDRIA